MEAALSPEEFEELVSSYRKRLQKRLKRRVTKEEAYREANKIYSLYEKAVKGGKIKQKSFKEFLNEVTKKLKEENKKSSTIKLKRYGFIEISKKAVERSQKDSFIRENLEKYLNIINKIIKLKNRYQTEKIGDFYISPRGGTTFRVAWHIEKRRIGEKEENILVIDDLLYHEKGGRYVDSWNEKARVGDITLETYKKRVRIEESPFYESLFALM